MSFKSLFNRINKQVSKEDTPIKAQDTGYKSALTDGKKITNYEEDLEKLQLEPMKQEIFDKIHALIEEHGGTARWGAEVENILQADVQKIFTGPSGMEFVKVPAGEFMMGSPESEKDRYNDESPLHKVTIRTPFLLGKYSVTQKQWKSVMGGNPSYFEGDDLPVEQVSWNDVQEFIEKLNEMEGTNQYRLPSEAEWEYACRAGTTTRYYFGDDDSKLEDYAWYSHNSGNKTHPVGQKKPNSWGLYDMHGNVWEWCQDLYRSDYNGVPSDGSSYRVRRGGGCNSRARYCRSAFRSRGDPDDRRISLGFRVLRNL